MSTILALDTTTDNCSVALAIDAKISQIIKVLPREHNKHIHIMIAEILKLNNKSLRDIDYIAVTVGPGSFTGIRLGLSVAQGLAFGLGIKIIPVSSLLAIAINYFAEHDKGPVLVGLDARMGEIYWAIYDFDSKMNKVVVAVPDSLSEPSRVNDKQINVSAVVGRVWELYAESLSGIAAQKTTQLKLNSNPKAEHVAAFAIANIDLAQEITAVRATYLRNNVAHKKTR
ncbi:MAG: tRNA (adenosine(37)-N6)-threonylcarbamoyltransferase complex dimerization subunit type 1 TsaB [Legionellales bacterium]|jgi:tRNA threonylcarbamoyladenosine biosynthesis protein TsaB|nr:tRNA (adenosine(37)-N6)-threonylcarbamoyltransferase complex dimerization subunit type 1 TsaB [Legionellales bacterium]